MPPKAAKQAAPAVEVDNGADVDDSSSRGGSVAPETENNKSSSSAQIRKAQNRIAQREFRLRKQQYIRDLEARVEILSGDKEERIELMLLLVRNLLQENKELRTMVKNMASFVGEGLGSCLPRLGLNSAQLDSILNRADTDTAYEAFVALKASKELEAANPGIEIAPLRKRSETISNSAGGGSVPKRKRADSVTTNTMSITSGGDKRPRGVSPSESASHAAAASLVAGGFGNWDFLFPDPTSLGGSVAGPGPSSIQSGGGQQLGFPPNTSYGAYGVFPPINPSVTGSGEGDTPESDRQRSLRAAVAHLTSSTVERSATPNITTLANNMSSAQVEERRRLQEELRLSLEGEEAAERKLDALQLVTYHLNNFRVNAEYSLPPSLHPTPVQQTVPHQHAIDGILFPTIRDRMILLRGRFDLVEAFHMYISDFNIHGDDVLDHRNWEPSERWLREFQILADGEVYAIANKWRVHRGLPPLVREPDSPRTTVALAGLTGNLSAH